MTDTYLGGDRLNDSGEAALNDSETVADAAAGTAARDVPYGPNFTTAGDQGDQQNHVVSDG